VKTVELSAVRNMNEESVKEKRRLLSSVGTIRNKFVKVARWQTRVIVTTVDT